MKIRALNEQDAVSLTSEESQNDSQVVITREAREDKYFESYKEALAAIKLSNKETARNILEDLVEQLENFDQSEDDLYKLKYSVLKNLALLNDCDVSDYLDALKIDDTDVSLWIKTGDCAMKNGDTSFARLSYEKALSLNPRNWLAVDHLMDCYYILDLFSDLYDLCLNLLHSNPAYKKATILLHECMKSGVGKSAYSGYSLVKKSNLECTQIILDPLNEIKKKRQLIYEDDQKKVKRPRIGLNLDTTRTQSLNSFINYLLKIYERFYKQGLTRLTPIDISLNSSLANSTSANPIVSSSMMDTMPDSGNSNCNSDGNYESEKSKNDITMPDESDANKSNSKANKTNSNNRVSNTSFSHLLFPVEFSDKRRSSRNRSASNHPDLYNEKIKFDELNDLLPNDMRISALERLQYAEKEAAKKKENEEKAKEDTTHESTLEAEKENQIIQDIAETICRQKEKSQAQRTNMRFSELLNMILTKIASKKHNILPDVFSKLYRIYRSMSALPTDAFFEINTPTGIAIDELWLSLAANELSFDFKECSFLLRALDQLSIHLDASQHREFMVRLFLTMGINSNRPEYLEAALSELNEDTKIYASKRKVITRAYIKTMIESMNQDDSIITISEDIDNSHDLINTLSTKSETEMSDKEISALCAAIVNTQLWQRGLDILNKRKDLNSDILIDTINTCLKNGALMDALLATKLCKEAINGNKPRIWTCLYRGWMSLLLAGKDPSDDDIDKLDRFFALGHQTLGKRGVCTSDNGEFLMLFIKHSTEDRDDYDEREVSSACNCLFGYPNKKSTNTLAGHKPARIPLTWEHAQTIYQYFVPEELPTYLSLLRKAGLTGELEQLFSEIVAIVPSEYDPRPLVAPINEYIEKGENLIEVVNLEEDLVLKNIYYFLADYYFKNKEFSRAKQFYAYDLALNPSRFDSWAASALIRANEIDKALSQGTVSCEDIIDGPFHELACSALRCFERATKLNPNEHKGTLWIEYGNLSYNLSSLAMKLHSLAEFDHTLNETKLPDMKTLKKRHDKYINLASRCFKSANKLCHSQEIWLHYYMLGKITERKDVFGALNYYSKADINLYLEGASYPKKILYYNTPELAYEALEIHYRIHAAALKFLLSSHGPTDDQLKILKKNLIQAHRSPFVKQTPKPEHQQDQVGNSVQSDRTAELNSIKNEVSILLTDILEDVCSNSASFDSLVFMCLDGMKRCLSRYDKNFKALYRVAHYYNKIEDPVMARAILMATEIPLDGRVMSLCGQSSSSHHRLSWRTAPPDLRGIDSLFKDRRPGNLFNNIWRIPSEEVDRPGTFEHWMFKCTHLLICVCTKLCDTQMLCNIAFQLSKTPDANKKYLHNRERVLLAQFAVKSIILVATHTVSNAMKPEEKLYYKKDSLQIADRFIKANIFVDDMQALVNHLASIPI